MHSFLSQTVLHSRTSLHSLFLPSIDLTLAQVGKGDAFSVKPDAISVKSDATSVKSGMTFDSMLTGNDLSWDENDLEFPHSVAQNSR